MDLIDLTLSSPEPEEFSKRPLHQSHEFKQNRRLPQAQASVKPEARPTSYAAPHYRSHAQAQSRPVNPEHLALIVNSSNEHALRKVLLDLCRLSPALSGAVARGLAPHSGYAQSLMRDYQPAKPYVTPLPKVKPEMPGSSASSSLPRNDSGVRRAPPSSDLSHQAGPSSSFNKVSTASTQYSRSPSNLRPFGDPHSSDSDIDLDLDFALRTHLAPASVRKPNPYQTPVRGTSVVKAEPSASSSRVGRAQPFSTQHSAKVKRERLCTLCHERYEDEEETCFYHPREHKIVEGVIICAACSSPIDDLGCKLGLHESASP